MPSDLTAARTEATITVSRWAALKVAGLIIWEFLSHPRSKTLSFTVGDDT